MTKATARSSAAARAAFREHERLYRAALRSYHREGLNAYDELVAARQALMMSEREVWAALKAARRG